MNAYKIYYKIKYSEQGRRVDYVKAETKKSAKVIAQKRKKKSEIVDGIELSNGCDCGQMWCPTCHG